MTTLSSTPARSRCKPILQALAGLLLYVGLLVGQGVQAGPPRLPVPAGIQTIDEARVSHDSGVTWLDVTLPDSWAQRGRQRRAGAQYALRFELDTATATPLALAFTRLGLHRRVSLNGQLLQQRGDGPDFHSRRATAPAFIDLPPALLKAGTNTLLIEVQHAGSGGLAAPVLGPTDNLRRWHSMQELVHLDLPQVLNLATLGLSLFMLTVWLRRRTEVALGCFGALALVTAIRNIAYFADLELTPPGFADWFFYSTQVASAVLLGAFAHAMAGNGWRWHRQWLWGLAVVLPLLAAAFAWQDHANLVERLELRNAATRMGLLRRWSYPVLVLTTVPTLLLIGRMALRQRRRSVVLVALGMGAALLAGVHDYVALQGRPILTDLYVLPFVSPLLLGAVSVFLVARMVAATGAAEALAVELDQRVALRTHQLSQANMARARFLSSASHDLRQPVLTIGLLASLLHEGDRPTAGDKARVGPPGLVARLQAAVASMERLLNGLLDLSRLDPLVVQARVQAVPLQSLFDDIAHHEQATAAAKGLRLRFRPTALAVQADRLLLEQVLRNLVSNALRYTHRGGVLVVVRALRSGAVRLQVWDTGVGIAAADHTRIFEEFEQLGNPGRDRRLGLGLGLTIAQRSAAAMGSAVVLRSVLGRGSCFSLVLPLSTGGETETAPLPLANDQPLLGIKVWVLDDDEALRDAMTLRLQAWGAQVLPLDSLAALQKALAEARQRPAARPALFMTDQRMADGSGAGAVRQVRAVWGDGLPCLLVTGDPDASDSRLLLRAGVPLLSKPFAMPALLQALQIALKGRAADTAP